MTRNLLTAMTAAMIAVGGATADTNKVELAECEGVWSAMADGYSYVLKKDGTGHALGYIAALPVVWNAVSNRVIQVCYSTGDDEGFFRQVLRLSDKGDKFEVMSNVRVDFREGKEDEVKEMSDKVLVRQKLDKESWEKMIEGLDARIEQIRKCQEEELGRTRPRFENPELDKEEFELSDDIEVKTLLAKAKGIRSMAFKAQGSFYAIGLHRSGEKFTLSLDGNKGVLGDEGIKDIIKSSGIGMYVEEFPKSARITKRGCDEKFKSGLIAALGREGIVVEEHAICYPHMFYAEYSGFAEARFDADKLERVVEVVVKCVRENMPKPIKVAFSRPKAQSGKTPRVSE